MLSCHATELARAGYFGADPDPRMLARAGDVWILGKEEIALYDASRQGTRPLGMVGQHGSRTDEERYVPARCGEPAGPLRGGPVHAGGRAVLVRDPQRADPPSALEELPASHPRPGRARTRVDPSPAPPTGGRCRGLLAGASAGAGGVALSAGLWQEAWASGGLLV
ncbi:hypothetical protein QJS66_04895 [Kocuria rhizophila]|nr:hypothetical protein QJS66_04895 [Kocuria rhizophila]